jgi:hypothetical protein
MSGSHGFILEEFSTSLCLQMEFMVSKHLTIA